MLERVRRFITKRRAKFDGKHEISGNPCPIWGSRSDREGMWSMKASASKTRSWRNLW